MNRPQGECQNDPIYSDDPLEEEMMIEWNGNFDYQSELWASERRSMANEAEMDRRDDENAYREEVGVPIGPLLPPRYEDMEWPCPF